MPNVQPIHVDRNNIYIRKPSPEYIVLSFEKHYQEKRYPVQASIDISHMKNPLI